jgi:hypothetical protein
LVSYLEYMVPWDELQNEKWVSSNHFLMPPQNGKFLSLHVTSQLPVTSYPYHIFSLTHSPYPDWIHIPVSFHSQPVTSPCGHWWSIVTLQVILSQTRNHHHPPSTLIISPGAVIQRDRWPSLRKNRRGYRGNYDPIPDVKDMNTLKINSWSQILDINA